MEHEQAIIEAGLTYVGTATDTASAVDLARSGRPDVVLVDLRPKDGEAGSGIALQLHPEMGIIPIFVTGNVENVSAEAKAICAGLLPKPVSYEALRLLPKTLRSAVSSRDPGEEPGAPDRIDLGDSGSPAPSDPDGFDVPIS
ncbi:hypothetical protein [Arenibaculum pallidiluteum]|uniref:hypothetical protein n=1 Tax=Arenibaculum pallidiluteum TaxID=2812559 RepID=UPI001A96B710|nr:hypothetical protein [Arenibaculum pallidiluteum]